MLKENKTHLTAKSRKKISRPMKYLAKEGIIRDNLVMLDYGCGKGFDCDALNMWGYDPYYRKNVKGVLQPDKYDLITCNYVLNVIPEEQVRQNVLFQIRSLLTDDGVAYVSVSNDVKELNGYTRKETWEGHIILDLPIVKKTSGFIMYKVVK